MLTFTHYTTLVRGGVKFSILCGYDTNVFVDRVSWELDYSRCFVTPPSLPADRLPNSVTITNTQDHQVKGRKGLTHKFDVLVHNQWYHSFGLVAGHCIMMGVCGGAKKAHHITAT